GGWALMAYHDGRVAQLPVALREQPFDAGVGSDAGGAPVVTFSRCRRVPSVRTVGEQGGPGGALVEPQTGIGCRVRLLELRTGRERALPIPAPRGVSDTTPSMWRGAVTFARHDPAHGDVWQVLTWSAGRPRRLMRLPHGRIPSCPEDPHGCTRPAQGMVAALDRDGAIVTFLWVVRSQGVIGEGAWEVRVDRTDGSAAALAGGGSGHEACPAPMGGPHELEYVWPEPPIAVGPTALFGELYAFSCFQGFAAVLGTHTAARGHAGLGRLEAVALAVARDHGRLYGLVPSSPVAAGGDSPGCEPSAPCAIEQIEMPPIRREARAPFVPFQ
ncbi:MAG: hypothetical protein JWM60_2175, partial [Solirubrobacterales bacterium]|nr:hypothetical protein [Solirubrobacterales bacterium]